VELLIQKGKPSAWREITYSMNEDNLDTMQLPRQQEVKRLDVNRLMRGNEAMNIARRSPDEFGEE